MEKKTYPCKYCDKRFSMSHLVKIHEGTHTKEKPYSCKRQKFTLLKLRHHKKLLEFKCEYCGKEFSSIIEITRLVRTIHHLHELIYSILNENPTYFK